MSSNIYTKKLDASNPEFIIDLNQQQLSNKEFMIYSESVFDGAIVKMARQISSKDEDGNDLDFVDIVTPGTETAQEWTQAGAGYIFGDIFRAGKIKYTYLEQLQAIHL